MAVQFTRIAVKIGSNVLARKDGTLDVTRMSALVDQVAELRKAGVEVILISSGAVASGRSEIKPSKKLDSVEQRQLFSAVGQAKLTAQSLSASPMEMVGMKMCQWELMEPVWWHLAPQTTMPSGRRSTTWTYMSGSACWLGDLERSPLGSVMAPSTVRSFSWQ